MVRNADRGSFETSPETQGPLFPPHAPAFLRGPSAVKPLQDPVNNSSSSEAHGALDPSEGLSAPFEAARCDVPMGSPDFKGRCTSRPTEEPPRNFLKLPEAAPCAEYISPAYHHSSGASIECSWEKLLKPAVRPLANERRGESWAPEGNRTSLPCSVALSRWSSTAEAATCREVELKILKPSSPAVSAENSPGLDAASGPPVLSFASIHEKSSPGKLLTGGECESGARADSRFCADGERELLDNTGSSGALIGGPSRPCLVLLDLDNTLIPTGWIMACWRKMQLYFGLQQAVACIRKGLEQSKLVEALKALFDDLRKLREKRHTQIVIVTNAGLRTVQEFYLRMCLPELRELCEREKVYIHSTEHFARRVGPIPPMTEEEAFCEFYTALKYHEFDFVVQRYLNALLCQTHIPVQGASLKDEESPLELYSNPVEPSCPVEGDPSPPRRSAPPFCKRARTSAQLESSVAAESRSGGRGPLSGCCGWCNTGRREILSSVSERAAQGSQIGEPRDLSPCKAELAKNSSRPSPLQQPAASSCCGGSSRSAPAAAIAPASAAEAPAGGEEGEPVEVPASTPLSLRDQLQAAAVAYLQPGVGRGERSQGPSPSESPRGFDPFPADWRCDLISAGDQVCEIHAACRVARHFAGHVKFAKLLFLRDPQDPRFLSQTPTRFIAQLNELHASLMHVISCDEETLDAQGHPQWVRRGSFSQVTIIAPERLEAPPRHCSAARVRHAFEFLRKRRTKSNKTASSGPVRLRQDLSPRQTAVEAERGSQALSSLPSSKRHSLSCPIEWERNAVANPPSPSPALCPFHGAEGRQDLFLQPRREGLSKGASQSPCG